MPEALRASVGKREIKINLGTTSVDEAKRLCPDAQRRVESLLDRHRDGRAGAPPVSDLSSWRPRLSLQQVDDIARVWRDTYLEESKFHFFALGRSDAQDRSGGIKHSLKLAEEYRLYALNRNFPDHIKARAHRCIARVGVKIEENSLEFPLVCFALCLAEADTHKAEAEWMSGNIAYLPTPGLYSWMAACRPSSAIPSAALDVSEVPKRGQARLRSDRSEYPDPSPELLGGGNMAPTHGSHRAGSWALTAGPPSLCPMLA